MPRKPAQPVDPEDAAPLEAAADPAVELPPTVPPAPPAPTEAIPAAGAPSVLERMRRNRMGSLVAALVVGIAVGLLLAVLVPSEPNLYAMVVLGALITAAVGFTVRYLSRSRAIGAQAVAFVGTVVGIHVMAVTGAVDGIGAGRLLDMIGLDGPGFDDALLAALATPAVSTGGVLAGLVAAIIAGWGPREDDS
ncbi:hypothetical protein [Demequina lignilytica]|uniref:Uncharacterized protein n=1 Tax=Demequina lignilytica TaxID=3051663 RepID=A0AB35MG04_9MICO|nr:hypothetical protein [Demequina sp. SYSU T0a273]MDN4482705.1 hypothetical protein [Demequina sp. SYSU T0a273]